jgi:hypothetical protein
MMLPIGSRGRGRSSQVCVFILGLCVLASCGGADKFELTLRARDATGSMPPVLERHWLTSDGRHATSPPVSGEMYVAEPKFRDAECGGKKWLRRYVQVWGPEMEPVENSFELKLDDGDSVTLDPQTAVRVADATGDETACYDEVGRWQGTAGDLRNHTGTFTIHYDSIQTVLRLVED